LGLPWLPWLRLPWLPWLRLGLAWVRWLRGLRRLLRTLGTVPLVLSSTTEQLLNENHPAAARVEFDGVAAPD
jgi:hypothetical protein